MAVETPSPVDATIGSGGDYATIGAWETATDNDLVAANQGERGLLLDEEHDLSTTGVNVDGATTDSARYRVLEADAGAEYSPLTHSGARVTASFASWTIRLSEVYGEVRGAYIESTATGATQPQILKLNADHTVAHNCVVSSVNATYTGLGIGLDLTGAFSKALNCIVIGNGTAIDVAASDGIAYGIEMKTTGDGGQEAHNCLAIGCRAYGIRYRTDRVNIKTVSNSVALFAGSSGIHGLGGTSVSINNATDDGAIGGTGDILNLVVEDEFAYAGGNGTVYDFRLRTTSQLVGAGVVIPGPENLHDIEGVVRDAWNIGPYETLLPAATVVEETIGTASDHATVAIWEAATDDDLRVPATNEIRKGLLIDEEQDFSTTAVTINAAITDVGRYRELTYDAGARYDLLADSGARITCASVGQAACLDVLDDYTRIVGIRLEATGTSTASSYILTGSGSSLLASGVTVIASGDSTAGTGWGFYFSAHSASLYESCISIASGAAAWNAGFRGRNGVSFSNCVSAGGPIGFENGGNTSTLINCVSSFTATADFNNLTGATLLNCASEDSTATGTGAITGIDPDTEFAYPGGSGGVYDFRLRTTSQLAGVGTDLSSEFTEDIEGVTWSSWGIGAYQTALPAATVVEETIGSGGDYANLDLWESATDVNLRVPSSSTKYVGQCLDEEFDVLTVAVAILSAIADVDRYRELTYAAGARYDLLSDTGGRVTSSATTVAACMELREPYARITGIRLESTGTSVASSNTLRLRQQTGQVADGVTVICAGDATAATGTGISVETAGITVRNCVVDTSGATAWNNGVSVTDSLVVGPYENCVVSGVSGTGFNAGSSASTYTNCVSVGATAADFSAVTSATLVSCASEDSTATGTGAITGIDPEAEFAYSAGSGGVYDFRLRTTSQLAGVGTDLSSSFTTDIEGATWDEWDIGAYATALPAATVVEETIGAGGDYATMASWEAATDDNLRIPATNSIMHGAVVGAHSDASNIATSGATTDPDRYRILGISSGAAPYDPVTGVGALWTTSTTATTPLSLPETYLRIDGFGVIGTGTKTGNRFMVNPTVAGIRISRMYIEEQGGSTDTPTASQALRISTGAVGTTVDSCVVVNNGEDGQAARFYGPDCVVSNTIFHAVADASAAEVVGLSSNAVTFQNCYAGGLHTFGDAWATTNLVAVNCAADDASINGTNPITGIDPLVEFNYSGGFDFRLMSTSVLLRSGIAITPAFDDITGQEHGTASKGNWNRGAYDGEVVRVAPSSSLIYEAQAVVSGTPWPPQGTRGKTDIADKYCFSLKVDGTATVLIQMRNDESADWVTVLTLDESTLGGTTEGALQFRADVTAVGDGSRVSAWGSA